MHIPDGYLGPQTYAPLFGASAVVWGVALRKVRKELSAKHVPHLAMSAAFSFLVMMFNIQIPGGTTGHVVGAPIITILLGPWTAVVAVSVVMIIQAVVFGDGGITAIGANCFNMAMAMPFVAYWTFRLFKGSARGGPRVYAAAFFAGYLSIVASAALTGVEFGIQPLIARAADGTPLYAPYPLSVAVPAMVIGHLAVIGLVEGLMTAALMKYFVEHETGFSYAVKDGLPGKLWVWLVVMALLSPLGLIIPRLFGAGGAWGEWGAGELSGMLGYLPEGLKRLGGLWSAPMPGYGFRGGGGGAESYLAYILSGLLGLALAVAAVYLLARYLARIEGRKSGRSIRRSFLDKGMDHLAKVINASYAQWEFASRDGFFQGLDARVKVLFLAFFIVVVSLKRELMPQLFIFFFVLGLAAASRLDLPAVYGRVFFLGLVFGFLIALPSSVNVLSPGDVVIPIVSLARGRDFLVYHIPREIGITRQGIGGVAMLTMRVINSVSLSLLVLYTTPLPEMMRALKVFRVPDAFIMIVNLSYKYIFIFARTVEDMHFARKSRTTGSVSDAEARKWVAGRMGVVFRKTQLRCEELFTAMLSRGFSGEVRLHGFRKAAAKDYAAGLSLLTAGVVFLII